MARRRLPAAALALSVIASAVVVPTILPGGQLPAAHAQLPDGVTAQSDRQQIQQVADRLGVPTPTTFEDSMMMLSQPIGTTGSGTCSPVLWTHSIGQPPNPTNGSIPDVYRPYQVTPALANDKYGDGTTENGLLISRPATATDVQDPQLPAGRTQISTMGGTNMQLDGWVSFLPATPNIATLSSRMRLATEYAINNINIAWRLDPDFTPTVTGPRTFDNTPAWASYPGYTGSGSTLTLTWERDATGAYIARVTGSLPAKSQAMITISGSQPRATYDLNRTFTNTAALTGTYADLMCSRPLNNAVFQPTYQQGSVAQGATAEVTAPTDVNGQALPAGTNFIATGGTPPWVQVEYDGTLILNPPYDQPLGERTFPVTVMYPDGTYEDIMVTVDVTPSTATATDVSGMTPSVVQGVPTTSGPQLSTAGDPLPDGTTFEAGPKMPSWVTVNPDGSLTLSHEATTPAGPYSFDVTITYPDGSTDIVTHTVTVVESSVNSFNPVLGLAAVNWGDTTTIAAPADPNAPLPAGTTFAAGAGNPDWVTVSPDGTVTVGPVPNTVPEGGYTVAVVVNYPDGTSETVTTTVQVNNPATPSYSVTEVRQAQSYTTATPLNTDGTPVANVDTYALPATAPAGMSIDPATGVITWDVPADYPLGSTSVDVTITYADGSTDVIQAVFDIEASDANANDPADAFVTVIQGQEYTVAAMANTDGSPITNMASFTPDPNQPSWITVNPDGTATVRPPYDTPVGQSVYTGTVTYLDGTTDTVTLTVDVTPSKATRLGIETGYVQDVVQGTTERARPLTDASGNRLPAGSTFELSGNPDWATLSPTGTLVMAPGNDVAPGDYPFNVTVTYPDGSQATTEITIQVLPNNATTFAPAYGDAPSVRQGATATIAAPVDPIATLPAGTTFAAGDGFPVWALVNADGSITVAPGAGVPAGDYQLPVTVTYPDGSSETINAFASVTLNDANLYTPEYAPTELRQGGTATVAAPTGAPEGTFYGPGLNLPDWATVNRDGTITLNPPADVDVTEYQLEVVVNYPDGTAGTAVAPVTVVASQSNTNSPSYQSVDAVQGETTTVAAPLNASGDPLPAGTTFTLGADAPADVVLNPDGSLVLSPDATTEPRLWTFTVVATYPDGSTDTIPVAVNVVNPNAPAYPIADVVQGQTYTSAPPANPNGNTAPAGTVFLLGATAPAGATVDPTTGVITWNVPAGNPTGVTTIPVEIRYPDGTSTVVEAPVNVVLASANEFTPVYADTTVTHGATATVAAPVDPAAGAIPAGATFTAGDGAPTWATVNPDGTISLAPGPDVEPGTYTVPVVVNYADGSTEAIEALVTVNTHITDSYMPAYTPTNVTVGETAVVPGPVDAAGTPLPAGTTVSPGAGFPSWATLNPDGSITLDPGFNVMAGTVTLPVLLTYPDGSTATINAVVSVGAAGAPAYSATRAVPGNTAVIPSPTWPDGEPAGVVYALAAGAPAGVEIDPATGQITWAVPADAPAGHVDIPVTATVDGEIIPLSAAVDVVATQASIFAPYYAPATVVASGEKITPAPIDLGGATLPVDTTFTPGAGFPDWASVQVNGSVVLQPPADLAPGEYVLPIVVTYPDGSTETVNFPVTVRGVNVGEYTPVTVVNAPPVRTVPGPSGVATSYAPGEGFPGWATLDPTTGAITLNPIGVAPGQYQVPVVAQLGNGVTVDRILEVTVVPDLVRAEVIAPAGEETVLTSPTPLPAGTTIVLAGAVPAWVALAPDGTLTVTPPADTPAQTIYVPATITYPDGTQATEVVAVTVTEQPETVTMADSLTPHVFDVRAREGGQPVRGADAVTAEVAPYPENTRFVGVDLPAGITVDPVTGAVSVDPALATVGDHPITITVIYPDGSRDTAQATAFVEPPIEGPAPVASLADELTPQVFGVLATQGAGPVTGANAVTGEAVTFPAGTEFSASNLPAGVTLDPATGALTVDPAVTPLGEYTLAITVTYPDGSTDTLTAKVRVEAQPEAPVVPLADQLTPHLFSVVATEGAGVTTGANAVTGEGVSFPAGTQFAGTNLPAGVTLDPATGALTVDPAVTPLGDHTMNVTVTYPDGSVDTLSVTVTVRPDVEAPNLSAELTPLIPAVAAMAGDPAVTGAPAITAEGQPFPAGTQFAGVSLPAGVTVDPVTGAVSVDPAVTPVGDYGVDVTVTYPDGSVDTLTVPVIVRAPVQAASDADQLTPLIANVIATTGGNPVTGAPAVTAQAQPYPAGTTFAGVNLPAGITVDPATGAITVDPAVAPVGEYTVELTVTYPDGSVDTAHATATVREAAATDTRTDEQRYTPQLQPIVVTRGGDPVTTPPLDYAETAVVPGATFTGVDLPAGVAVDPDTGAITVDPAVAPAGTHTITVEVTYPDGTSETVTTTLTVKDEPVVPAPEDEEGSSGSSGSSIGSSTGSSGDMRCVAIGSSVGLPLLALIPLGVATQVNLPGLNPIVKQVGEEFGRINLQLQQATGTYHPELARLVGDINSRVNVGQVVGAAGLITSVLLLGALLHEAC